ncbi:NADPH-dependent FMN reductase [Paraburkholderia susongensis]|uniref:FMN reductase n=1 Tax=Paraburkholderia susongensis TaxID=1515439 RepID=A0A1X7JEN0_9BURK|nr:NAD(P)H-dependent oxidoreductase [Paraburkholderia susongensis]SMG26332.1 FMN reductase [Paraburkholderia susongensis]
MKPRDNEHALQASDAAHVMAMASAGAAVPRRPLIVGVGGTLRPGSATERLLRVSLAAAEAAGADVEVIAGGALNLPIYTPGLTERAPAMQRVIDLYRRCDGLIIASPAYHGSVSGLIKNVLDYTEDLRGDARVYFDGCAIGCICCAAGWQAAGQTLTAMRSIAHALRGWPTPLGAMVNTSLPIFDVSGLLIDEAARMQLEIVGQQVTEFARKTLAFRG